MLSRLALAAALTIPLAACGSQGAQEETTEAAAEVAAAAQETPAAGASETPAPGASETPAADASATPSPSPSASASATPTPSPTPTKVAAAGPPDAFKQCTVCHKTTPGDNLIGPTLAGVYGAKAGHIAGFKYSPALLASGLTWNQANLDRYLADPKGVIPGGTMSFGGVKDDAKRKAIVDYLKTL